MEKLPLEGPIVKPERSAEGPAGLRPGEAPRINDLPLPDDLLRLISEDRWKEPSNQAQMDAWFPDRDRVMLYPLGLMERANSHWRGETSELFLGEPDTMHPPGDIEPLRSLVIGDIGIGFDQPIALDYRDSMESPRVVFLRLYTNSIQAHWIELAPDVRTFAEALGL
jgi:hypothetical protein